MSPTYALVKRRTLTHKYPMIPELPDVGACLSADRVYRYWLGRKVPDAPEANLLAAPEPRRRVLFVMLNPSTASETENDPTVRKLLSYAKLWGFTRLDVVNLFAFRSPSPTELARVFREGRDIVGPETDVYIDAAADRAHQVVVAWGGRVPLKLKQSRPSAVADAYVSFVLATLIPDPRDVDLPGISANYAFLATPFHPMKRQDVPTTVPWFHD